MNVINEILRHGQNDSICIISDQGNTSYKELTHQVGNVSSLLTDLRTEPQSRVLLVSQNSTFWVATYLGVIHAGMVAVPISPQINFEQLSEIISQTDPVAIFVEDRIQDRFTSYFPKATPIFSELDIQRDTKTPKEIYLHEDPDALAAIMYTSGSTGKPRGVMISHRNIRANTVSISSYLSLGVSDRMMVVLPFFYCFGTSLLHTHLYSGASLVISNKFMFVDKVLNEINQHQCSSFAGVPSTYQLILRKSSFQRMNFPFLKKLQIAGGKLADSFIDELVSLLPNAEVYVMYGQTEATARLSYLEPSSVREKRGSIGKGIPDVTLEVLNSLGERVSPGEMGEIVASGENISKGYWGSLEESAATFKNDRLYTGDLATLDSDGYIYVLDRAKDFLKCAGYRVSAKQIEDTLVALGGILELAVVSIPDEIQGEAVKLYVVPKDGVGGESFCESIREYAVKNLPPYLLPKEIVILDSLPKNSAGKVLKSELKNLLNS